MKTLKKTLAILLAAVMTFAMCGVAFAVDAPEGFVVLPTSPDGLEIGEYYFDLTNYVALWNRIDRPDDAERYANASYFINGDQTQLKIYAERWETYDTDTTIFENYVKQVAASSVPEGYFNVPLSPDGLSNGDYWYNTDEFSLQSIYPVQYVYLSNDLNTIKVGVLYNGSTLEMSETRENAGTYFAPLHQVGEVSPWTEIPLSPAGLEDGAYWFNPEEFYMNSVYPVLHAYLKNDVSAIKVTLDFNGTPLNMEKATGDEDAEYYFAPLHQVGEVIADPYESWTELPFSAAGLNPGDYYFDAETFTTYYADIGEILYVYLKPDHTMIAVIGTQSTIQENQADQGLAFLCLSQVDGSDPTDPFAPPPAPEGYELIWYDKANVDDFGFYIDIPGAVAALYPETPEDEVYLIAETMIETGIVYYIDPVAYYEEGRTVLVVDEYVKEAGIWNRDGGDVAFLQVFAGDTPVAEADYPDNAKFSYEEYCQIYNDPETLEDYKDELWYLGTLAQYICVVGFYPSEGTFVQMASVFSDEDLGLTELPEVYCAVFVADTVESETIEGIKPLDQILVSYTDGGSEQMVSLEDKQISAFDLSFVGIDENDEIIAENLQPADGRSVFIKTPVPEGFNPFGTRVYYINEEGVTKDIPCRIAGDDLCFELTHCSLYLLVEVDPDATEPVEFNQLPTADSDELDDGEYWFDAEGLVTLWLGEGMPAEYADYYRNAAYYINDDVTTLRIIGEDEEPEDHSFDVEPELFDLLHQHESSVTPACTHDNMQATPAAASTCRTPGNSAYWYCPDCETYFSDANGENVIGAGSWVLGLDPDNHEFGAWTLVNASTCQTKGSEKRACPCGAEETRELDLDPDNHTPGEAAKENDVPSTCTEYGSYDMVVRCTECGEILESEHFDYTELAPHAYGEWVTVTAATCHSKGLAERRCVCGETEQKELDIDPANHDGETELRGAAAATCTEAGYTGDTYCLGCGDVKILGEAIAAAGHQWGEWTVTKEATETEKGEKTRECSVCHETQTEEIPTVSSNKCKWCGEDHSVSFWQRIVGFFHNIIYFFAHLFGKR